MSKELIYLAFSCT